LRQEIHYVHNRGLSLKVNAFSSALLFRPVVDDFVVDVMVGHTPISLSSQSSYATTGERVYFGTFVLVLATVTGPMLLNPITYNDTMNAFGRLLGDSSADSYSVDTMPDRLRFQLLRDLTAVSCGFLSATIRGWSGIGPLLVTVTSYDVLGTMTSFWSFQKYGLKGEWIPIISHGMFGMWGLGLCWNFSQRTGSGEKR
jgi:hypothetical protein